MCEHDRAGELDDSLRWFSENLILKGKIIPANVLDHLHRKGMTRYKTHAPIQNHIMRMLEKRENILCYWHMNNIVLI